MRICFCICIEMHRGGALPLPYLLRWKFCQNPTFHAGSKIHPQHRKLQKIAKISKKSIIPFHRYFIVARGCMSSIRYGTCRGVLVLCTMDVGTLYLQHPWNHWKKKKMFGDHFWNFSNFWLFPMLVRCFGRLRNESYGGPQILLGPLWPVLVLLGTRFQKSLMKKELKKWLQ